MALPETLRSADWLRTLENRRILRLAARSSPRNAPRLGRFLRGWRPRHRDQCGLRSARDRTLPLHFSRADRTPQYRLLSRRPAARRTRQPRSKRFFPAPRLRELSRGTRPGPAWSLLPPLAALPTDAVPSSRPMLARQAFRRAH